MANTKRMSPAMRAACKVMLEQIQRTWGNGWRHLGDEMKGALIAERVLHVFTARNDEHPIQPGQIHEYLMAMRSHCGLDREGDQ